MKVIFMGTNGWYDSATGNTISILLQAERVMIILDAGYGLAKLDRYLEREESRPAFLCLSHFHLDHVAGLHTLAKARLRGGLTICGPSDSRKTLDILMNQPFTLPLAQLPYPASVLELPEELDRLPFKMEARPLRHSALTLGFRIELDGCVVAYCADTGYCDNAVALARDADLLIAECAYASGCANEAWPHLNPETAARIASEGKAKRLVLVHFDAQQYPRLSDRETAVQAAKEIFPETVAALDGLEMDVPQHRLPKVSGDR